MTVFELLQKASSGASELQKFLNNAGQRYPDLKPKTDELSALLQSAIDPSNISLLATSVLEELKNIAQGKIDPRDSPSNAI